MNEEILKLSGLPFEQLPADIENELKTDLKKLKALAVAMPKRANSGHPAGSLSSLPLYMMAYAASNLRPDTVGKTGRDYVAISHGHTSPAAYATLSWLGFCDAKAALAGFRKAGSLFAGHVERDMPGIDWTSGNLGQGLSAAVGFALAQRAQGYDGQVFVLMGDGEQPKGQIAEARRLAVAQGLKNITALIDANDIQISGRTGDVLPCNIKALWEADGWKVLTCDGGSFAELYRALKEARVSDQPCCILAKTIIGAGVSFMEDRPDYHGKAATGELYEKALSELGQCDPLADCEGGQEPCARKLSEQAVRLPGGTPRTYTEPLDCRSAFGNALTDVADEASKAGLPLLAFDCDLAGSVKTDGVRKQHPAFFVQGGIQEHNTATVAGAASVAGVASVFGAFGMFGLVEVYNQQRLNDINETNLKLALTHSGLDVGEDGKTHQCVDYLGLLGSCLTWKVLCPADANQTDRALRWMMGQAGNQCLVMGRSKLGILKDADGKPVFDRPFQYGEVLRVREGSDAAILALGPMIHQAVEAAQRLEQEGIKTALYAVSSPLRICDETLKEAFATGCVVTLEDHRVTTGFGSQWLARAAELGLSARCARLGVTEWGISAPSGEVYKAMGLDGASVAKKVAELRAR